MPDKKEKPISIRLSTKALARLNRLSGELDMNRTSVIQEALKALDRELEAQKARSRPGDTVAQNGSGVTIDDASRATELTNGS